MNLQNRLGRSEMLGCALCGNAPCDGGCPRGVMPARLLRSIWFGNEDAAAMSLGNGNPCAGCGAPCEEACVRPGQVPIRRLVARLVDEVRPCLDIPVPEDETALRAEFCGIPMENPFLLSSSVVASTYEMCARAFEAGWAGAAFKTISALDIHEASPRFSAITGADGSILGFKNIEQLSDHSVPENMAIFRQLKKDYPGKLLLASIMGNKTVTLNLHKSV